MPGFDQTGPNGMGPMTGRGAGRCAGARKQGRRMGQGGRGWRYRCWATGQTGWQGRQVEVPAETGDAEIDRLTGEAQALQQTLAAINERLDALRGKEAEQA